MNEPKKINEIFEKYFLTEIKSTVDKRMNLRDALSQFIHMDPERKFI